MAQFDIGYKFIRRNSERRDVETITDIHTTTNYHGEVVKTRYVATHEFMGQTVTDRIPGSTIARGETVTN